MNEARKLLNELKSVPCMDCVAEGKDGIWPPECMDFDHRPGEEKLGQVGKFLAEREKFWAEVKKCDVICANHHRMRTKSRGVSQKTRNKMSAVYDDPEYRASQSAKQKIAQNKPEVRERRATRMRETWEDPVKRAAYVEVLRRVQSDPETNARRSASLKAAWARRKAETQ